MEIWRFKKSQVLFEGKGYFEIRKIDAHEASWFSQFHSITSKYTRACNPDFRQRSLESDVCGFVQITREKYF